MGAAVALVLVGVGVFLFVERRQDIAAEQAAYRRAAAAETTSVSSAVTPTPAPTSAPPPAQALPTETPPVELPTVTSARESTAVEPAADTSGEDRTYLDLLEASGYTVGPDTSSVYIDGARSVCRELQEGRPGVDVVNSAVAAAQGAGLSASEGEGVVYIGVATYCNELSDALP